MSDGETAGRIEGRTTVRGCTFAHDLAGPSDGPAVVWGHGLNSSRASERIFGLLDVDELATDHRVLRYDARSHGETEMVAVPDGPASSGNAWCEMALDQVALASALGLERFTAAGASLGTATALWSAVLAPERVERLVLVIPPTGWETREAQTDRYNAMARAVERAGVDPLIRGLDQLPVPDPFAEDPAWLERAERTLRDADPVRLARRLRDATTANLPDRAAIAATTAPMSILAWTGDSGHPMATAEELCRLRPDAELVVAGDATQLSTWTDRVRTFLRSEPHT